MSPPGDPQERRRAERFPIADELSGEVMVLQPITVQEISRSGALIESVFPLQLNSLHQFRLALGRRAVVVTGRVAHCRISDVDPDNVAYRSGIDFVEISEPVRAAIEVFIAELMAGRKTTGAASP